MGTKLILSALALAVSMQSGVAAADNPNDPSMRTAEARAKDRAIIRRLNQEQLAHVRQRDAKYAQGWRDHRGGGRVSQRDAENYAEARQDYARKMAAWRRAVAACRAGDRSACD